MTLPSVSVSQSPEGRFREYLASRPEPKRFTPQQRELLEHIFARHKHFDANELIEDLKAANRPVSRATVYRTLTLLVDAGLLKRIEVGSRTVYDHDYGYPDNQGVTRAKGVTSPLFDYGPERTSPAGIVHYTGDRYPARRGRYLMCENHGHGLIALRIKTHSPARLLNYTPLLANCTIDIVQTRDGTIVFSNENAIYRLAQQ